MSLDRRARSSACRFLAEVLLYPEDRDREKLQALAAEVGAACAEWRGELEALLADSSLDSCDAYLERFEMNPGAPLYLGHYLFEEPTTCQGAAVCGRNSYMIQLKNLYCHFGLQMDEGELSDYLPLMLEFLALSAEHPDQERRRWMIQRFMLPALPSLTKALAGAGNPYSSLAAMLDRLLRDEAGPTPATQSGAPALAGMSASTAAT